VRNKYNQNRTNWYGETKKFETYKKNPPKSLFYEAIRWFETWVLIFLLGLISLFIYLS
jgi:phage terminase large subunit-like protein